MVELIIAEKPSAAKKIAEALADGIAKKKNNGKVPYYELSHKKKRIIVGCAVGHIFSLAEKKKSTKLQYPVFDIAWKASHLANKDASYTKDYHNTLKKLSAEAKEFTVACDYDVEGSVIGLNIIRYIAKKKDANRMKFSTLTTKDLITSYENKSKHLNWGQALAGETRHYLDYYYGINLSRALMKAIKSAGQFKILSTGRVQGPALKILTTKEKEIQAFKAEPYWELELEGQKEKALLTAQHKKGKFFDKKEVTTIHKKCKKEKTTTVTETTAKTFKQAAPYPFDLTTLQTEAYRNFRIKPKDTLDIAQTLYLSGVISYPRTSSQQYPKAIGYKNIVTQLGKHPSYKKIAALLKNKSVLQPNNGRKKDPAHPAIYPTGTLPGELYERDAKIYDLIVKRFFATFGDSARRETVTITLDLSAEVFIAKGTRTTDTQWHELYAPYVKLEEEELPPLKKGDILAVKTLDLLAKETQAPKRYTPASLIKELEKNNLGTKATRSEIIETLIKRNYAKNDPLEATEFGIRLVHILEKHVPQIVDPELTRQFEEDMEAIYDQKTMSGEARQGSARFAREQKEEDILSNARIALSTLLEKLAREEKEIGEELKTTFRETKHALNSLGDCPHCEKGQIIIRRGKYGAFAGCNGYPDCKTIYNLPKIGTVKAANTLCGHCKTPIVKVLKRGKRPQELCINKSCPAKEKTEKIEEKPCPNCDGTLVERRSFYGSFLGCNNYPKCKTMEKIEKEKKEEKKG